MKFWVKSGWPISAKEIEALYYEELNQEMPITYIALYNKTPVGSCSLQLSDDIRPDLYSKYFEMQQGADEDESRSIYIICEQRIKSATQLHFEG